MRPYIGGRGGAVEGGVSVSYNIDHDAFMDEWGRKYRLTRRRSWLGRNWKWMVGAAIGAGVGYAIASSGDDGGTNQETTEEETAAPTASGGGGSAPEPAAPVDTGEAEGGGDELPW